MFQVYSGKLLSVRSTERGNSNSDGLVNYNYVNKRKNEINTIERE